MGGVCPGGMAKHNAKVGAKVAVKPKKTKSISNQKGDCYSDSDPVDFRKATRKCDLSEGPKSGYSEPSTPIRSTPTRKGNIIQKSPGRVGELTADVLDTILSGLSKFNPNQGCANGSASGGNRISILAFEVANTIDRGVNLLQSLSEENIQVLKKEILHPGVQQLVSTDIKEMLSFAAADKRQEFEVFLGEVIRFGDLCKDPQWHNLGRSFARLDSDDPSYKQLKVHTETTIQELTTLAQKTSELYHELNAFERFEQDYQRKLEEMESLNLPRRGESLKIFHNELEEQRKLVRRLKKKSLWSENLEGIVKKLVDVVTSIHQAIWEAFGNSGTTLVIEEPSKSPERLGEAGLALHYANIINQISIIASRPTTLPPNLRDQLYRALPESVKVALRSQMQTVDAKEQLSIFQIKAEMEKTLKWLVPVATNTIKAHQGFGWVGEWAKASNEFGKSSTTTNNMIRLQTLYYADKEKTDLYILKLVTLLHRVISLIRRRDHGFRPLPLRSPTRNALDFHSKMQHSVSMNYSSKTHGIQLSQEDKNLLDEVIGSLSVPGISKSQKFTMAEERGIRVWPLSRSTGSSPTRKLDAKQDLKTDVSDIMDRLEFIISEAS
ncbi:protein PSK SIMULATOR 2 [Corylus avellana]|uniref:protein PSK SIMULATOR 2 n=1 Tax=Corylus avellana TaxID=13451 RepID=UPI00286A7E43|nr:protein PSK SIMULATOR 2 [Corylus avellana]